MNFDRFDKHFFIKAGSVLFLTGYLLALSFSGNAKDVPMEKIASSLEAQESVTSLDKRGRVDMKRFYQIDDKDTEGYLFHKAASPMAVEEIFIVKAHDKEQANTYFEACQSHLDSQKQIFGGYGTDQMALLDEAIVETRGDYAYYFCGPDALAWRQALLKLI